MIDLRAIEDIATAARSASARWTEAPASVISQVEISAKLPNYLAEQRAASPLAIMVDITRFESTTRSDMALARSRLAAGTPIS